MSYQWQESKRKRAAWCDYLRKQGYSAAREFDGWVKWRTDPQTVTLIYMDFCQALKSGDLIAIGSPNKWWTARLLEKEYDFWGIVPDSWTFEWVGGFHRGFEE